MWEAFSLKLARSEKPVCATKGDHNFELSFDKLGYDVWKILMTIQIQPEVAETGMTFEENARLKAETISQLTGKMAKDDSAQS